MPVEPRPPRPPQTPRQRLAAAILYIGIVVAIVWYWVYTLANAP